MSDTPRTDAQPWVGFQRRISPEFCRTLERELTVVTAERDKAQKYQALCRAQFEVANAAADRIDRDRRAVTAERDALAAKLAESQKDTERLDWLQGHQGRLVTIVRRALDWNDIDNLRAELDAARTKQP